MFCAPQTTDQITSTGKVTISKKGNIITVKGEIKNVWKDKYDWNLGMSAWIPGTGNVSDDDGIYLRNHGGAKDFDLRSFWSTSVSGTITQRSFWFDSNNIIYKNKKTKK